jgi:predicted ester cyclase
MKKLFMILPLALILCFMVGCQDKAAVAELEAMKAQAEVEEQNTELIRNFLGELDSRNWDIVQEIFADDCKFYYPSDNDPVSKKEQFTALDENLEAFPKWEHNIKDIFAEDDKVVVWTVDVTTHEGEFQGIPATGFTRGEVSFGFNRIYTY